MEQIRQEIRTYILDSHWPDQEQQLGDDDSFMELGALDSLGLLQLVSFVEEKYSIHVGHNLSPENLDSVSRVTAFVQRNLAANASVPSAGHEAGFSIS